MALRLTRKERTAKLRELDAILMEHRMRIALLLQTQPDAHSVTAIRQTIDQLHRRLLGDFITDLDACVPKSELMLPFTDTQAPFTTPPDTAGQQGREDDSLS